MREKIEFVIREAVATYGAAGVAQRLGVEKQTVFKWADGQTIPLKKM